METNVSEKAQAVRLTHVPTGIVVESNTQRATEANLEVAKRVMQVRLALLTAQILLKPIYNAAMRTYDYSNGYVIDNRSSNVYRLLQPFVDGYKTSHLVLRSHLIAELTATGGVLPFQKGNAIIVITDESRRKSQDSTDESSLFVADLCRMYVRYAEEMGLEYQFLDSIETGVGGYTQVIFEIKGDAAHNLFSLETGLHQCLRVPHFTQSDTLFTSLAAVCVLNVDRLAETIRLNPDELVVETYTSYAQS